VAQALLLPRRQRALGLQAPPAPSNLHGHRADVRVAGFGDALLVSGVATRLGGGRQAAQGADCLPIAKGPPTEALHDEQPGTLAPNPFEHQELLHFLRHGLLGRLEHHAAFGLSLGNALRQRRDMLPLLTETVVEARREWGAVPQAEGLQLLREVSTVGPHQAVRREQPLETVDDPRPIPFRGRYGARPLAAVCFRSPGDPDDPPHLPFPRGVAQEHREPLLHIEPISLGPSVTAMHCNAGRVDHAVVHPLGHSPAVQPEAVPARLVTADAPGLLGQPKALLGSADLLLDRLEMACRHVAFPGALGRSRGEAALPVVNAPCEGQEQCRPVWGLMGNADRGACGHGRAPFA
jgi:hypothetical protein